MNEGRVLFYFNELDYYTTVMPLLEKNLAKELENSNNVVMVDLGSYELLKYNMEAQTVLHEESMDKLKAKYAKAMECVRFYGDKENWYHDQINDDDCDVDICINGEDPDEVNDYWGGKLARQTMRELGEK